MTKSKSLFQRIYDIFENWDEEAFRSHHHEDFIHLQETDFLNRDEHVEVISELATKPGWNWHKIAKCIYEDEYVSIIRWEDNGEIVTHVSTIKMTRFGGLLLVEFQRHLQINIQMLHLKVCNSAVAQLFQNQKEIF